jgi:hypothetical protein
MDEALLTRLVDEVVNETRSMADLDGVSMSYFLHDFADKVLEEAAKVCDRFPFEGWDSTHDHYTEPNPAAEAIRALKEK